jgi:hypothetical protein
VLVQQVLPPDGSAQSWTVLGDDFAVIEPIDVFLAHLTAIERSPGTVRSYAFDLRDYSTFLDAHRIDWVMHPTPPRPRALTSSSRSSRRRRRRKARKRRQSH